MTSSTTGSFWHALIHNLPAKTKTVLIAVSIAIITILIIFVFAAILYLVIQGNRDINFGPEGFKSTRSETTLERNCRTAREGGNAWSQSISNEILTLESQEAMKDHDLSETRSKCLAAVANTAHPPNEFRCHTEDSTSNGGSFAHTFPRNDHEVVLENIAQEKYQIELKIEAKEQERRQLQQQFNQRCLGTESHVP